jgi:predicted ATP-grasp superfamily ATP-dependent carboligase
MNALIINAKSASSLAVIRSLGRRGIEVTGASDDISDFPLFSKYCTRKILLLSDPRNLDKRIEELLDIVKNNYFDVFLPVMSEKLLIALAKRRDEFEQFTRVVLPSLEQLTILTNKSEVASLMTELGIPGPATYTTCQETSLASLPEDVNYPLLIKPFSAEGATGIKIVTSRSELEKNYNAVVKTHGAALVQEFLYGTKYTAVFLLNKNSELRRFFVHRAIREYPVTGGPSCFMESVKYEPIREYGVKLLKRTNFSGLAEMEFIIDEKDGQPKIIDVNPRFYGSVQCAISSGVDFPYAMFMMALNGDIEEDLSYREGVTCRHLLFEDTKHMVSVLRGARSPKYKMGKMRTLVNYLNFFNDNAYFVLSVSDPMPALKKLSGHFGNPDR